MSTTPDNLSFPTHPMRTRGFGGWIDRQRAIARERSGPEYGAGLLVNLVVFMGTTLTVLLSMLTSSASIPLGGAAGDLVGKGIGYGNALVFWAAILLLPVAFDFISPTGGKITAWWKTRKRVIPGLAMSALLGVMHGGVLFSMIFVERFAIDVVSGTESYTHIVGTMEASDDPNGAANIVDATGRVKPELRAAWCERTMPMLSLYQAQAMASGRDGRDLSLVLLGSGLEKAHLNGCISDEAYADRLAQNYQAVLANPGRGQKTIDMQSWFPVMFLLSKAHPQVMERALPSPAALCTTLAKQTPTWFGGPAQVVVDIAPKCEATFSRTRVIEKGEMATIRQRLEQWRTQ